METNHEPVTQASNSTTPVTLATLSFHGEAIFLADKDGRAIVPMKFIAENLGLAWQVQHRKFQADSDLWGYHLMVIPSPGGAQEMGCIPLENIHGWLLSIQASRVKAALRDKLRTYQRECFRVLNDYWTKGAAVHPSALQADPSALADAILAAMGTHEDWRQPLAEKIEQGRRHAAGAYRTLKDEVLPALERLQAHGPVPAVQGAPGTAREPRSTRETIQLLNAVSRATRNPQSYEAARRLCPDILTSLLNGHRF